MDNESILAHAEARANLQHDGPDLPSEADYAAAEAEVRQFVAEGWTYDKDHGWMPPA